MTKCVFLKRAILLLVIWFGATALLRAQPTGCTGTDPGGNAAANGLYTEYYAGYFADNTAYFTTNTPGIRRVEAQVNFPAANSWGDLTPTAGGTATNPDQFSSRMRGRINITTAGSYTFYLTSDDASYLWLDAAAGVQTPTVGTATINNGTAHGAREISATVTLSAGLHNILIQYGEAGGDNVLKLEYASTAAGITRQIVPTGVLCTAIKSAPNSVTYSPASQTGLSGSVLTSSLPAVNTGNDPVTAFAIDNASSLPAGISINTSTGVLTANATVPVGTYSINVSATNANGTSVFTAVYSFRINAGPPVGCTRNDPGGNAPQAGLYAEYYAGYFADNISFFTSNSPGITRVDAQLNFPTSDSWGNLTPTAGGTATNPDFYSSRYRGSLYVPTTGSYTFYLTSDDASYMWIDNAARVTTPLISQALINNGGLHSSLEKSATVTLTAGLHDVKLVFGENGGTNLMVLEYASAAAGISRQVIPSTAFCSGGTGQPLPVTLTRFGAQVVGANVQVSWETASEQNSAYFIVERSANGQIFETVARVAAAGSTLQRQTYALLDRTPLDGVSYYRLRQVDTDGTEGRSSVVAVQKARSIRPTVQLFPNPATRIVTVRLEQPAADQAVLELLDVRGQLVQQQVLKAATSQEQQVNLKAVPAGIYLLRITTSSGVTTERLVRE